MDARKLLEGSATFFRAVEDGDEDVYMPVEVRPAFWMQDASTTVGAGAIVHIGGETVCQVPESAIATSPNGTERAFAAAAGEYAFKGALGYKRALKRSELQALIDSVPGFRVSQVKDRRNGQGGSGLAAWSSVIEYRGE